MLDKPTELRCPACSKLLASLSDTFDGAVSVRCHRCRTITSTEPDTPNVRLSCRCGKWLAMGAVRFGTIRLKCRWDDALVEIGSDESRYVERPKRYQFTRSPDSLVRLVEERWALIQQDRVRKTVELAVGLRFDVFNRDGFRCRYCGRGADRGVSLEADHVVPRSAGGPDTLDNLVTSCWDCNRGKAAKRIIPIDAA